MAVNDATNGRDNGSDDVNWYEVGKAVMYKGKLAKVQEFNKPLERLTISYYDTGYTETVLLQADVDNLQEGEHPEPTKRPRKRTQRVTGYDDHIALQKSRAALKVAKNR